MEVVEIMLDYNNRINSKRELNDWLSYELSNYSGHEVGGGIRKLFPITENDILRKHQLLLRKSEYHINTNHKVRSMLYRSRLYRLQNKYSLHIPVNCCGRGLKIMHLGPILMNGNVTLGKNVSVHINSGLVAAGRSNEAPILGDGVVVGFGATVLGGVHVADNVAIGAGAIVTKSFEEENIAIAGNPARKISENGRLTWN